MPDAPKASSTLKLMLCTHIIFGLLLVWKLAQGAASDSDFAQFKRDTRQIERLFLDPEAPAITLADRRRVAKTLFPNMSESDMIKLTGDK